MNYQMGIPRSTTPMSSSTSSTSQSQTYVYSPSSLSSVTLRTTNMRHMLPFYRTFLNAHVAFYSPTYTSLRFSSSSHSQLSLITPPHTTAKVPSSAGLQRITFLYDDLVEMLQSYMQRREAGIRPFRSVDYGAWKVVGYVDPDGNEVEIRWEGYDNEAIDEFMRSDAFLANPSGTVFEPEDLLRRMSATG